MLERSTNSAANSDGHADDVSSLPTLTDDLERVLHVLDFEIDRIRSEQKRPGWTIWAVYGAIATAVWLLAEQIFAGTANLINVFQLLVALSITGYLLEVLAMAAPVPSTEFTQRARFRWFHDSTNRRVILLELLRAVSTLILIILATAGLRWYEIGTAFLVFGGTSLLSVATVAATFFKFPIKTAPAAIVGFWGRAIATVLWSAEVVIFGWLAYIYAMAATSSYPVTLAEVRIALLVAGIGVALKVLAKESYTSPLLVSLIETRRELVFGNLDLNTAIVKAEIAIAGMNETDVFQEQILKILRIVERIDRLVINATRSVEKLTPSYAGPTANPESAELAQKTLDHGRMVLDYARDLHREREKEIKAFQRRRWLVEPARSGSQLDDIENRILNARTDSDLRVAYLDAELRSLENIHAERQDD